MLQTFPIDAELCYNSILSIFYFAQRRVFWPPSAFN